MDDPVSGNDDLRRADTLSVADTDGHAALLLVESLIHNLIARSVISLEDAIETVNVAFDVKEITGVDLGHSQSRIEKSLRALGAIRDTLQIDLPDLTAGVWPPKP